MKSLKISRAPVGEIQYVSRLLRKNITVNQPTAISFDKSDHDQSLSRNFWGYVKRVLQSKPSQLPTFSLELCKSYFLGILSAKAPNYKFPIPSWIPSFGNPVHAFDSEPPSYQKITSIIRRMKSSSSPCPLDQISIICFKRCPYLRSFLTELIRITWSSGCVPSEWKKACTILVHKKGNTADPSNFRPITLQSVPLKIFTSCLRNSIFDFLKQNGFIEHKIQKGFTHQVSGTLEHTAMMGHVINKARTKQRSLVITLLDLKNAFGEIHHNLIQSVLSYHHVPENIQSLCSSLYINFKTINND